MFVIYRLPRRRRQRTASCVRPAGRPDAAALLASAVQLADEAPAVVAVDLPCLAAPSSAGGRRTTPCPGSTALANAEPIRPASNGQAASATACGATSPALFSLIEVYPHPALVELAGAPVRLLYKIAKVRAYWPGIPVPERRRRLLQVWAEIVMHLEAEIEGVAMALPPPAETAPTRALKSYEDALDAVVCAWVGGCAVQGRATPFGDDDAAIWIPNSGTWALRAVGLPAA